MSYVDGDFELNFPKSDRRSIPPGESETEFIRAEDYNGQCQAIEDLRDAVGTGVSASVGDDQYPGGVMPLDYITDYSDPDMATSSVLIWKGNDNQGTALRSMDHAGLATGTERTFTNSSTSGIDVGTVILKHEDTAGTAAFRFCCPSAHDYKVPINGVTKLIRGYNPAGQERWLIEGSNGTSWKTITQALHLYPNIQVGTPGSPKSGSLNNFNPTGEAPFAPSTLGIAGSNLIGKDHTFWRMFVDAAGATLTGILGQAENGDVQDFGRLHVIKNYGPGTLTIAHRSSSSDSHNQIWCPNQRDLVIPSDGAVWLIKPFYGVPDPGVTVQWHVLGAALSNEVFPAVTTTGRTTTQTLTVGPQLSPSALSAGLTSDYSPGAHAVISVAGTSPASLLDGLVPADALTGNEIRIIRNSGSVPIILVDELSSASTAGNRFNIPNGSLASSGSSSIYVIVPGQEIAIQYRPTTARWALLGGTAFSTFNTATSISPAALAGANVDDYAPTDSVSGLAGRYAYWWFIQGAFNTVLRGIDGTPSGCPPFQKGDRILLTNLGAGMTIKNNDAGSAVGNRFLLSGDIVLSTNGSHEFIYNGSVWMSTSKT